MSTFDFLQEKAVERGWELKRATNPRGFTKRGYVVSNQGDLKYFRTLIEVWTYIQDVPEKDDKSAMPVEPIGKP